MVQKTILKLVSNGGRLATQIRVHYFNWSQKMFLMPISSEGKLAPKPGSITPDGRKGLLPYGA